MSEFGKGLTYCIGLFLSHAEREKYKTNMDAELWFNGASDHLFDLVIPETLSVELIERLKIFKDKILTWGHGFENPKPTMEDKEWAVNEAKELLLLIDKNFGIATEKSEHS